MVIPGMKVMTVPSSHMSNLITWPLPATNIFGKQQGGLSQEGTRTYLCLAGSSAFFLLPLSSLCFYEPQYFLRPVLYSVKLSPTVLGGHKLSSVSFFVETENENKEEEHKQFLTE